MLCTKEIAMLTVSVQELQKRIGDVQLEASRGPVLITSHGKPRCVLLSVEEFARLKSVARETVPSEIRKRPGPIFRAQKDPLGYDLTDLDAAMRAMTEDALSGRTKDDVQTELAVVRRHFGARGDAS
jgi:prevent-host-death family protein